MNVCSKAAKLAGERFDAADFSSRLTFLMVEYSIVTDLRAGGL